MHTDVRQGLAQQEAGINHGKVRAGRSRSEAGTQDMRIGTRDFDIAMSLTDSTGGN